MADEKRVKLGVDIGALSQELLQVNRLVEENYQKSIKGQTDYNSILEESIKLLQKQAEIVSQLGGDFQNSIVGSGNRNGGGSNSPLHVIVDNTPLQVEAIKGFSSGGGAASIGGGSRNGEMSISDIKKFLILIDKARGADSSAENTEQANDNETESKENDILRAIQEDLDKIWEKFSEGVTVPIPVDVQNHPLDVKDITANQNGGAGGNGGNGSSDGSNGSGGKNKKNFVDQAAGMVQPDLNYLLPAVIAGIPFFGAGVASIITKLIAEAEQYDTARHKWRATSGRFEGFGSLVDIGLKDADAFEKLAAYYPANINLRRSDLQFEKGFNISGGTLDSLLRSFREDIARQIGASIVGVNYLQGLSNRGKIEWNEVRGYSEDYLKILVELNQKQLETTGETNSLINSHIIQGIASLSNKFGDPTVLSKVVQGLQGALTTAKTPQMEALQYWALSQVKPGASLWELELMKANPFGPESAGYLSNMIGAFFNMGGNLDDVKRNIKGFTGWEAPIVEEFVNGIVNAKRNAESGNEAYKKFLGENGEFDLSKYLETQDFGNISIESSRTTHYLSSLKDNRPVYEALPELLRKAGLDIEVKSGLRPGAKTVEGKPSRHATGEAVDIVPKGNTTYADIQNALFTNPDLYRYMLANGIGLLDETSATGTTRFWHDHNRDHSHFHLGKDSDLAERYRKRMQAMGVSMDEAWETYTEIYKGGGFQEAADLLERESVYDQTRGLTGGATSGTQKIVAEASNTMAQAGMPFINATNKILDRISPVLEKVGKWIGGDSFEDEVANGVSRGMSNYYKNNPLNTQISPTVNNTNPQQWNFNNPAFRHP